MRRISSGWTFFYKRVFPLLWFGFLVVFVGIGVVNGQGPFVVIVPIAMIGFGYFIMQKLVFDLVDEVSDDGDALVVKNRGQEQRIALADIKNVNYSPFISPPRVTLSLRRPTVFGDQITFCAPVRLLPFSPSPVIADLIERVDHARRHHAKGGLLNSAN
jgi:hypothetical protein